MSGSWTHAREDTRTLLAVTSGFLSPSLQRFMQHLTPRPTRAARHAERKGTSCGQWLYDRRSCSRPRRSGTCAPGGSFVVSLAARDSLDSRDMSLASARHLLDLCKSSSQSQALARARYRFGSAPHPRAMPSRCASRRHRSHPTLATSGAKERAKHRSSYVFDSAGADSARYMHNLFGVSPKRRPPTERSLATVD